MMGECSPDNLALHCLFKPDLSWKKTVGGVEIKVNVNMK